MLYDVHSDDDLGEGGGIRHFVEVGGLYLGWSCCSSGDAGPSCEDVNPREHLELTVEVPKAHSGTRSISVF